MRIGRKITLMLGAILITTVIALGVYANRIFSFSLDEFSKTYKNLNTSTKESDSIEKSKPFSILLMGVDTGSADRTSKWEGNSDTMILVTVNPKTKKTTMTSLERDILVQLSGPESNAETGYQAKLNAAYASGGAQMAIMTVQEMLDITIDNYMLINMEGLVQLVDAVGGITVTNNFDYAISIEENEPAYTAKVEPGTHKINGEQALVYSRMRYDDPEGDYGRQKRQREVIQKVMEKLLALDSVSKYKKILSAVSKNIQTDIKITGSTIPKLMGYADTVKNIKSYQLKGEDATLNGGSYQMVTSEQMLKVQNRIKKQLGLETVTADSLKTTAVLYETLYGSVDSSGSTAYSDSSTYDAGTYSDSGTYSSDTYNQGSYQAPAAGY
ncbi:glycopolymer--peptidoglycan transferase LytR [Streptococcus ferus]|uniref:glycopolymer--peptidoglycan transferase LytR n=1 Tax=Streptococcus ferus TaxID=1345 RepID=UPI00359F9CF1